MRLCKVCEMEFNEKDMRHKGGYINVCGYCSEEDVPRAIGVIEVNGKSDVSVGIIKNATEAQRRFIKRQGKSTANTCQMSMMLGGYGNSALQKEE